MSFVVEVEAFDDAVMCESPCWQSPSLKRQLWKQIFKLESIKYQTKMSNEKLLKRTTTTQVSFQPIGKSIQRQVPFKVKIKY
ncbi:hypothetical protein T4E_2963 [Trichinella pseudospiralis]|uniref:Uncharacterized protein n=1 Tax=Trichinella pseudospiralis TaxID=6337 RepID=A0A0V0Y1A4_TRIPS|nr:hypothetical protein T4E_2963 [Trichinella pseudospiralis]